VEIKRHGLEGCGTSKSSTHPKNSIPPTCSPQLVNKDTKATVAQSRSRIRSSMFKKPRDMGLEISEVVSHAADVLLLTFILVWKKRQNERGYAMRPPGP
jgi:hypothetical protein